MAIEYKCAVCEIDMTRAVLAAMRSSSSGFEVRLMRQSDLLPADVTLTCPNGHTCTYAPPSANS